MSLSRFEPSISLIQVRSITGYTNLLSGINIRQGRIVRSDPSGRANYGALGPRVRIWIRFSSIKIPSNWMSIRGGSHLSTCNSHGSGVLEDDSQHRSRDGKRPEKGLPTQKKTHVVHVIIRNGHGVKLKHNNFYALFLWLGHLLRFWNLKFECKCHLSHAYYMSCPSYHLWFDHNNNWRLQIILPAHKTYND